MVCDSISTACVHITLHKQNMLLKVCKQKFFVVKELLKTNVINHSF